MNERTRVAMASQGFEGLRRNFEPEEARIVNSLKKCT